MAEKMSRDVFIALAAVCWADGRLDADEADGIVRAALECGVDLDGVALIEDTIKAPCTLESIEHSTLSTMDPLDGAFVYATAIWLARLDGVVEPGERTALRKLGDLLGLSGMARTHASAAALEAAQLPEGDRPSRYDLASLRKHLETRLRDQV